MIKMIKPIRVIPGEVPQTLEEKLEVLRKKINEIIELNNS